MEPVDHRSRRSSFRWRHWLTVSAIVLMWGLVLAPGVLDWFGVPPP